MAPPTNVPHTIYIDARALQDPDYRLRGVGQHSASLIESLRRNDWVCTRPQLVAVTDARRASLLPIHSRLFDSITTAPRPSKADSGRDGRHAWYLCLSPMTHDPVWASHFLTDVDLYRIALFYDLIPLTFSERYLASLEARRNYVVCLAWLHCYDSFAAISRHTADELIARVSVSRSKVFVTGVAVRRSLEPEADESRLPHVGRSHVVVSGGGDTRKNPECALIAHAQSDILREAGSRMIVFGSYPEAMRADLRTLYAKHGGLPQNLEFLRHVSDETLREIYRGGLATVVPSRAEGFSIPIVESSAAGTPVLASNVDAHPELILDAACRFDPDDSDKLQEQLERLKLCSEAWESVMRGQEALWREYTVEKVGHRFVEGATSRRIGSLPFVNVLRKSRPSVAVLTPLPPAHSGVADYSAVTLRPLKTLVDLHMFTPTPDAAWEQGWKSLSSVSMMAFSNKKFDATVSIIGNSQHHTSILDYLLDYGGGCIAHDARQIDFYYHLKGIEYALNLASQEFGQPVNRETLEHWLRHQDKLPILFLSEIAKASDPLMVHSSVTADIIAKLYKKKSAVLPFAQYRAFSRDVDLKAEYARARGRLGLEENQVVVTTFGHMSHDKGAENLVWVLKMLRTWHVNAILVFCGDRNEHFATHILKLAEELDIQDQVVSFVEKVPEQVYVDYLYASDVGVQLRTYFMGGLSGAMNDCIAVGLPVVANEHLAVSMEAPDFVRRVPDQISSVLIAEAVLDVLHSGQNKDRPLKQMREFQRNHSPLAYCRALLRTLSIDIPLAGAES